jgi:hypothetical protein
VSRLPSKYRVLIILCDLEGKTSKEAAQELGLPVGTVASRLIRTRRMPAKRLTRLCLAVSFAIRTASLIEAGQAADSGAISIKVAALTEGVMKAMMLTKFKIATMVLLVIVAAGAGASELIYHTLEAEQPTPTDKATKRGQSADEAADRKMLEVKLRYVRSSDDKQHMINVDLDRYYAELDDRGKPRTNLPVAKDVEVLIDGKKAKVTDLLPGDKILLQLAPDNKSVTKIKVSLKPRLDALEKEVDALRQRIKRLEKVK